MTDTASGSYFASLAKARYLRLTTFKRKGAPVSTPVPGIVDGDRAYFGVSSRSGAVKRAQHTDGERGCRGASQVAGELARPHPVPRRSLARLLPRARRRRLVYYELLGG